MTESEWVTSWLEATGAELSAHEREFLRQVAEQEPPSRPWTSFERFALEGTLAEPVLVTYFRLVEYPDLLFGDEWPLRADEDFLEWAVWYANLDEDMGTALPLDPGPDGVVRLSWDPRKE